MLNQQTSEKLHAMRLHGMAEAFRAQPQQLGITDLSFEERFALLVDQQWNWRQNRALTRRLEKAKLRHRACVEDIDFRHPRGLDRSLLRSLTQDSSWVREHQNVFLIGPCGIGKSFLACALAEKACRDGFTACYTRTQQLFRDLSLARADGSLRSLLARFAKTDVLLVDEWGMAPLTDTERRDFLEICEDRYQLRSTILTSQLPVAQWHEQIGDPTVADSCSSPIRCARHEKDFFLLGASSSVWDCRLICRPAKDARRKSEPCLGRVTRKSVWSSEDLLLSLRCHCITMVQPAESRKGLNLAFTRRANFCRPTSWRVLRESKMSSVLVIVE